MNLFLLIFYVFVLRLIIIFGVFINLWLWGRWLAIVVGIALIFHLSCKKNLLSCYHLLLLIDLFLGFFVRLSMLWRISITRCYCLLISMSYGFDPLYCVSSCLFVSTLHSLLCFFILSMSLIVLFTPSVLCSIISMTLFLCLSWLWSRIVSLIIVTALLLF